MPWQFQDMILMLLMLIPGEFIMRGGGETAVAEIAF
jgi:hypothetical protein